VEPWRGRFPSKGSNTILIDYYLSILHTYIMGLYLLLKGMHGTFDKQLWRFFW
jgi:hypothetical protein